MEPLPPNFIDVARARHMTEKIPFNVIGKVVDFMPSKATKTGDRMFTFSIKDAASGDELRVRLFRKEERHLPPIASNGDIILLRSLVHLGFQGVPISNSSTSWTVFPVDKIPDQPSQIKTGVSQLQLPAVKAPTPAELAYVISLHTSSGIEVPANPVLTKADSSNTGNLIFTGNGPTNRSGRSIDQFPDKLRWIEDIECSNFFDLTVEVIKSYPSYERVELYVTDYTENNQLYNRVQADEGRDGDEHNYINGRSTEWQGPWGRRTLQVCLFPPHAEQFLHSKDNRFLLLKNVHVKQGKDSVNALDGAMHSDRQFPDRQCLFTLSAAHPRQVELLRRRNEYWAQAKQNGLKCPDDVEGSKKRKAGILQEAGKKAKKKREGNKQDAMNNKNDSNLPLKPAMSNPHIRSSHEAIPPKSIPDILQNDSHDAETRNGAPYRLPFQNLKYRASCKVVDFFPHKLKDFSRLQKTPQSQDPDGDEASEFETNSQLTGPRWEWCFGLVVEDARPTPKGTQREQLELYVFQRDAEYLLGLDADDLHHDQVMLNKLREKLFILWGNLEELKSSSTKISSETSDKEMMRLSAKPFTCCIKEYGVHRMNGQCAKGACKPEHWDRKFRMFGTRIM